MEADFKEYLENIRQRIPVCQDINELRKMQEILHDVMIRNVAFLRENGMKTKLTKTWRQLISEFY